MCRAGRGPGANSGGGAALSLRLLKVVVDDDEADNVARILEEHGAPPHWRSPSGDSRTTIDAILPGAGNEPVLEALEKEYSGREGFRLVLLPVQATIPRIQEKETKEGEGSSKDEEAGELDRKGGKGSQRISREELYTELSWAARTTPYYLVMVGLSAVVASAGLLMGDTAVIIGAMVIAPLLGPNMALGLSATLGDTELGKAAFGASAVGAGVAFGVSLLVGLLLTVDPEGAEIAMRTSVGFGHVALALAAGAAGVLSITGGMGVGLVGVMVAVALLPPLVAAGLLIGDGWWSYGFGALLLVVANVSCVNLAAIATFLAQGVRPLSWWEEGRARRATAFAAVLWAGLVVALLAVIWMDWGF